MDQSGNLTMTGTVTAPTFSGALSGNATSATTATNVASPDGDRNPSTKLPTTNPRNVRFDFATSASIGGTGNYGGVMTYTPWDGTSASTGDSSYQLAFLNETGVNASGVPGLSLRNGINSTWNSWYRIITSGNIASQTVGNTTSISSATGSGYNWTGIQYFVSNRNTSSDSPPLQAYSNNGGGAIMSFHRGGYYAVNMGLDSDNVFRIGGWSAGANRLQLDMSGNLTLAASVNAPSGYVSSPNPWSTADSAYFPNGITTGGGTNWIYGGNTYIGNAPSNGAGHLFQSNGNQQSTGTVTAQEGIYGSTGGATNQGIQIRFQNYTSGYGRIRFYENDSNTQTIHCFSAGWQGGGLGTSNSAGGINISGTAGVTFGSWNSCDGYVATGGSAWFRGDVTAYSDARVKDDVQKIDKAIEKINSIRGVTFTRNDKNDGKRYTGVIAQEILSVLPEAVTEDEKGMYSVAYGNMAGLFIEGFKEQQKQIEKQQKQIEELKSIINGFTI
jgi:hypothetical protein